MEKVLEGDLSRFAVTDVLSFLSMGKRTGVLLLERSPRDRATPAHGEPPTSTRLPLPAPDGAPLSATPDEETKLFLRDGRPVFAVATRGDLRLGSLLVKMGRVTPPDLERLLKRQGVQRLGDVLLSEKLVSEAELASFLKVQISEVIFDTFVWHAGVFTFYDNVPPPSAVVTLEMDLQNLIMEGVRRIDERVRLEEVFTDRGMVVEALTNPERVKQGVSFTPEEWQVFFLVDGRRSVSDICRLVGNPDELATLRVLNRLLTAKFVTLTSASVAEPQEPPTTFKKIEPTPEPTPGTQYSVEFQPARPPKKVEDDTHEIVNPKAGEYQKGARTLTVSRLILVKDGQESAFPLTKDSYTLGRAGSNDIVISNPKVSSFHARLDRTPNGFLLVDLKSRNGCWVNGQKIEQQLLKTGDEIRLGPARLTYKVDYQTPVA